MTGIPHVLHRIWLDDPVPDRFQAHWAMFGRLHPDWELIDWRDSKALPPLINQDLFDDARKVWPKDWKRFQADLLRLELLHRYGGVYVDADIAPLRPFTPLEQYKCAVPWSPNRGPGGRRLLSQYVLASEPGHPFIAACIDAVPASAKRFRGRPLAQAVGPWMVTRVWHQGVWDDVTTVPERVFADRGPKLPAGWTQLALHGWNSGARRRGKGV